MCTYKYRTQTRISRLEYVISGDLLFVNKIDGVQKNKWVPSSPDDQYQRNVGHLWVSLIVHQY